MTNESFEEFSKTHVVATCVDVPTESTVVTSDKSDFAKQKVDFNGLEKVFNDWHHSFIDHFQGEPVRVDEKLEGGQYYIAVSKELYERISHVIGE